MDLSNIALYVDGPTEEGALSAWFNKYYNAKPEFRYGPGNGVDYSITGYARNVTPKVIQNLKSTIHQIVFIPDFEKRKTKYGITLNYYATQLKTEIINNCAECSDFSTDYLDKVINVCPSDIMFENWIICDIDGIKNNPEIVIHGEQGYYDGKNGSSILSSMMDIKYKKTIHAKKLYKYVEPEKGMCYSCSYKNFLITIQNLLNM